MQDLTSEIFSFTFAEESLSFLHISYGLLSEDSCMAFQYFSLTNKMFPLCTRVLLEYFFATTQGIRHG